MSRQPKEFRVVCYDQERVNQCIRILTNYTGVDEKNQIEVTIKPYKKNRSKEQNNTLWMWYNIFVASDPACRSAGELHEHMKRKYLIPLLEAKDVAYRDKLEQLRGFYRQGQVEAAEAAFEAILWLSSTTTLNVTEMTSFMESVHSEAESLGIVLPLPDKEKRT